MYKMIAIDMDGTLLNKEHKISRRTKEAIKAAKEKGVKIVLASGRPVEGLMPYLEELDLVSDEDYVLGFNGALVQNTKSKKIIKRNVIKGKDLSYLYGLSKELGVNVHAFNTKGCITPIMSKYSTLEGTLNNIPVDIIKFEEIKEDEDIIKFMMVDEEKVLSKAISKLPNQVYEEYTVVRSAPYFLEFLSNKANKGEGVKELATHLDFKAEEVICIGDAGNDLHMIEFAGLGVAMDNGFEEVKKIADYITDTNERDGVAKVIEKFVLSK